MLPQLENFPFLTLGRYLEQEYLGIAYEELTWSPFPGEQITMTFFGGRLVSKAAVIK